MRLSSPEFADGAEIPARFTCDGADVSPALVIEDVARDARSLVLVVDDPDAPRGTFVHWLLWNLPPTTSALPEGIPAEPSVRSLGDARQGTTDFRRLGYGGPCPPDGRHMYRFLLYALDRTLDLEAGAQRAELDAAMKGHIVAETMLRGSYAR